MMTLSIMMFIATFLGSLLLIRDATGKTNRFLIWIPLPQCEAFGVSSSCWFRCWL